MSCGNSPSASSIACANSGPTGMAPASPAPLMPSGLSGDGGHRVGDLHVRHFERGRQQIIGERGVEQLPVVVEHELLVEGIADALRDAAVDLAGEDQRIDDGAAIVHDDVFEHLEREGLRIDLDDHGVHAARGGAARRAEILRRFEARLGAGTHRAAHRIGLERQRAELDRLAGNADDRDLAVGDFQILLGAFEMLGGELEDLLPHRLRRLVDGVAGHHRAAAREGAGAPVELIGVAGHDIDVAHLDAELVGDDLREAR